VAHVETLPDFFDATRDSAAERPFLIFTQDDSTYTYQQAARLIGQAAAVWHHLGVRHGDRVAVMLDNRPLFVWAWLGLARLGGILVAVNTGYRAEEANYLVVDSGATVALVGTDHLGVVGAATVVDEDEFARLMTAGLPVAPPVAVEGDDVVSLIYTSGTTGNPKGVMQTHRNYVLTGQGYVDWMRMADGDRIYACLPLFHINSQAYSTMAAIAARGTMVLAPRFSARRFWPDVRRHHVTVFNFIGAMAVILSKKDPEPEDADNDVRIAYGVPALPAEIVADIERRFGLRVISGFGMSETTFGLLEPLDRPRRPGSMGIPRHHPDPRHRRTEAKIVDEHGAEVPRGTVGELVLRNAAMMTGYHGDPAQTAAALRGGWLHTGDSAYQDVDGFFYFVDRLKDIVRRRGENVSSLEVERAIARHDAIAEAAVIGVPAALSDEELMVFVVPRPGARAIAPDDVFAWAAATLAPFKVPTYLRVVDALPKTATAKVRKDQLRAEDARDPALRIVRPGGR
jgi:carnitine-CoA ligase